MVKPTSFKQLDADELYRSALEDFALPVEEEDKGKKKVLLAAFLEGGVEWADYVAQHPEVAPEEEKKPDAGVVTASGPTHNSVEESVSVEPENKWDEDEEPVKQNIIVSQPLTPAPQDKYLIKMVRDNPLYTTCGYRFTSEHPYCLVDAKAAEYILTKEDGFRQATPGELQEFYG